MQFLNYLKKFRLSAWRGSGWLRWSIRRGASVMGALLLVGLCVTAGYWQGFRDGSEEIRLLTLQCQRTANEALDLTKSCVERVKGYRPLERWSRRNDPMGKAFEK